MWTKSKIVYNYLYFRKQIGTFMNIELIDQLLKTMFDPLYYDEEIIVYYDYKTASYNIAKTLDERITYEQRAAFCIDLIAINRLGFDFVFTAHLKWHSRHYGQRLLQLVLTDCDSKTRARETLEILNDSISTVITLNQSLVNN